MQSTGMRSAARQAEWPLKLVILLPPWPGAHSLKQGVRDFVIGYPPTRAIEAKSGVETLGDNSDCHRLTQWTGDSEAGMAPFLPHHAFQEVAGVARSIGGGAW